MLETFREWREFGGVESELPRSAAVGALLQARLERLDKSARDLARVGYEAEDFGVRAYVTYSGLWGVDAYARVARASNITARFGAGIVVFKDFQEIGLRGLIGIAWTVAPSTVLALEFRPMYLPLLWSDLKKSNLFEVGESILKIILRWLTLFSATISLEYHF